MVVEESVLYRDTVRYGVNVDDMDNCIRARITMQRRLSPPDRDPAYTIEVIITTRNPRNGEGVFIKALFKVESKGQAVAALAKLLELTASGKLANYLTPDGGFDTAKLASDLGIG